jgi:ribosomal protein S12 methylthiotransferase
MIASLCAEGLEYSEDAHDADIIIVNTCGFIEEAKQESIDTTLLFKSKYPEKKVIMAGCLSERYGDVLASQLHEVDGFTGNAAPENLGKTVSRIIAGEKAVFDKPGAADSPVLPRNRFLSFPGSAYVKIAEGCNNRCSYCAIPIIRGSLSSRSIGSVTDEIKSLVDSGIVELNLVAQDAGNFGAENGDCKLPQLLESIGRIPGRFWVRLLYLHPDHFPFPVLDIVRNDNRFLPYFDIPFQHASGRILSRMGRKGNGDEYLGLIERIRTGLPDAVIRSTFLVGFPGEDETDFSLLSDFQHSAMIDWLGVFCYSKEEGTVAAGFPGRVKKSLSLSRKNKIENDQVPISEARLDRFLGRTLPVLVEEEVIGEDMFLCRGFMHAPEIDGLVVAAGAGLLPGKISDVVIVRRNGIDLEGRAV